MARDAASAKPRGVKLGGSKGFGFIAYETHEEAKLAAETLTGKVLPDPEGRRPTEAAAVLNEVVNNCTNVRTLATVAS